MIKLITILYLLIQQLILLMAKGIKKLDGEPHRKRKGCLSDVSCLGG